MIYAFWTQISVTEPPPPPFTIQFPSFIYRYHSQAKMRHYKMMNQSQSTAALLPPFVQNKMLLCNLMILRYNFDGNDCSSILNFWQLINVTHDQSFEFWHRTTLFFIKPSFCFLFSFLAFSQCIVSFFCNLWDN